MNFVKFFGCEFDILILLCRYVRDSELEEGLQGTMDRKSFKSLLARLVRDNSIKIFKIEIEVGSKNQELTLICAPQYNESDPQVQSIIEQQKMKLNFHDEGTMESSPEKAPKDTISESLEEMKNMIGSKKSQLTKKFDNKYGRINGVKPKFVRTRELHKYLFYLTRNYSGNADAKSKFLQYLHHENIDINAQIEEELENMEVYQTELSWKTFIPDIPKHKDWPDGWCFMSDILLRLPLSIFLQLVCLNYKIDGLDAYKDHPIR